MEARESGVILVVDDDAEVRRLLAEALEPLGVDVLTTATGEETLEILVEHSVSLLFLDLGLPGIDGLAVLEKLEREGLEFPVIVLVDADGGGAAEAQAHGACGVLAKPVRSANARALVQRHLAGGSLETAPPFP